MPRLKLPSKVLFAAALLAGCATSSEQSDGVVLPKDVHWSAESPGQRASSEWWKSFGDPHLTELITRALRDNPDMAIAAARVREARASVTATDADLLPRLDAKLAQQDQRISGETGRNFPGLPRRSSVTSVGVQLSWEIDLWDRAGSLSKAALNEAYAAGLSEASAKVSLAAEVARTWFAVRLQRENLACLEAEFAARMAELAHTENRFKAGIVDSDFISAAKLAAAQAKAAEADGRRRLASAENALRVLVGAPVGAALPATTIDVTGPATLAVVMPEMSAGVPSDLLLNRPDIQAVERQLDASVAREGAARANYYPHLTLIGDAGWQADPASRVGQGSSGFWSLTPTLTLPIFEGTRNDAALEQAQARFDIARGTYRKAVLNAFREVDDALVDIRELGTQELLAGKVVEAVRERLVNAEARVQAGLTNESEVLSARLDLFLARRTLAAYGWERRQAAVRLAAATGGGWQASTDK